MCGYWYVCDFYYGPDASRSLGTCVAILIGDRLKVGLATRGGFFSRYILFAIYILFKTNNIYRAFSLEDAQKRGSGNMHPIVAIKQCD